jgi:hypothetical protein
VVRHVDHGERHVAITMIVRRVGGVVCLALAAFLTNGVVKIATEESLLAESGTNLSRLIFAAVPIVLAVAAGLWLLTSKPVRAKASVYMGQAAGESALAFVGTSPSAAPHVLDEGVTAEWHACSKCGATKVHHVESTTTCECREREKAAGAITQWPPCPKCGNTGRQTNAFVARCADCGAVRRGAVG